MSHVKLSHRSGQLGPNWPIWESDHFSSATGAPTDTLEVEEMLIFHVHEEDPSHKRHPVRSSLPVESPVVTKSQMTIVFVSFFICGNKSFLLSRISCKHASELKKNVIHQKCIVPANMFSKLCVIHWLAWKLEGLSNQSTNKTWIRREICFSSISTLLRDGSVFGARRTKIRVNQREEEI